MVWVKAFHVVFMVTWFAGLFYLPRLFVYHSLCSDQPGIERFKIMERKLFFGIMTPGAVLTIALGLWMLIDYTWSSYSHVGWLYLKLFLVALLVVYHVYCGKFVRDFKHDRNTRGHVFFRWFNEIPVLFLVAIVILAVVKPF